MEKLNNKKENIMKKLVIVVDYQYDFYSPKGALYVKGGENLINPLTKLIESLDPNEDRIVFTQDYHPSNHCSFKGSGGPWPFHCVENSKGVKINETLLELVKTKGFELLVSKKGMDQNKEEYGAFLNEDNMIGMDTMYIDDKYIDGLSDYEIILAGIAGDYCVLETLGNVIDMTQDGQKVSVYLDGVVSIDKTNKTIKDYMTKSDINEFKI